MTRNSEKAEQLMREHVEGAFNILLSMIGASNGQP